MDTTEIKKALQNPVRAKLAIASLVLSLLSILLAIPVFGMLSPLALLELIIQGLFCLSPLIAFVLGVLALSRIGKGQLKIKICAGIGIFLSIVPSLLFVFWYLSDIHMYTKSRLTTIDDMTKETTVLLRSDKPDVWGFSIYISGYIDGSAMLSIQENAKNKQDYKISGGNVRVERGGDWYSDQCVIKYKPMNVNSGHLKIRYYFGTPEEDWF